MHGSFDKFYYCYYYKSVNEMVRFDSVSGSYNDIFLILLTPSII